MILVTGGTGFLGGYLLRYLVNRGETVRATCRSTSDFSMVADIKDQIDWVECDLLDLPRLEAVFQDVTHVYHAAAVVSFKKKDAAWMMKTNVDSTKNIVNCSLAFGVRKLVFASSIAALGRRHQKETITEEAVWERSKYNTTYGISKFRSEREVWRGIAEGLDAAMINPTLIMGAGKWNEGTPQMFKMIHKGIPAVPRGVAGLVDVRDVARLMIQLMESEISGQRYIANSESFTYLDLFSKIARHLDKQPPRFTISKRQGIFIAYLNKWWSSLTGQPNRIQLEFARNFGNEYYYPNDKIKADLGAEFTPIDQTLADTAKAFLEKDPEDTANVLSL